MELVARISKFFVALLIIFKVPIILMMQQIIFCIQPKILDPLTKSFFPCAHIAA